jgi:acyl-coenzyme A thioesterase PaaI-like protein
MKRGRQRTAAAATLTMPDEEEKLLAEANGTCARVMLALELHL